jgi:glycosyltransferase involved in cell wall biosynthesis
MSAVTEQSLAPLQSEGSAEGARKVHKMRICFVLLPIEHYSPVSGGAIATITYHVTRELVQQGHEVFILAAFDGQPNYLEGTVLQIFGPPRDRWERLRDRLEAHWFRWDWHGYGRFRQDVLRWLEALQPDVVSFSNDLLGAEWARVAAPGARLGVWLHNACRCRRSVSRSLRDTDFFIACSGYLRSWYLQEYGLDPRKISAVLAGVDHTIFRPRSPVGDGALRALFVGRLDYNKGLDLAIDAVGQLRAEGIPVSLTVAGSVWFHGGGIMGGDYMERMRPALQRPGVRWFGHVPREWIPRVMSQCEVCLVLSRSEEPFGLVVLEAMASGLAVITSGRGGLGEAAGGAALEIPGLSASEVASALRELQSDPAKLALWSRRSLARACGVSWQQTARGFLRAVSGECEGQSYATIGN